VSVMHSVLYLMRFNPLHCGAVVASTTVGFAFSLEEEVSIPFIAGQWSLRRNAFPPRRGGASFNPLHCGAVVASAPDAGAANAVLTVSIPFIAGQWSLRGGDRARRSGGARVSIPFIAGQWSLQAAEREAETALTLFQSPSLRGSGRFRWKRAAQWRSAQSFNPLHCGAVVASPSMMRCWPGQPGGFNPLHCGAVVAS